MTYATQSLSHRSGVSRLTVVVLLAFLLSACTMRAVVEVDVNPDGSGVFEVSMAFDEELRTLLEEESTDPIDWSDPRSFEGEDSPADMVDEFPEGASITSYSEDDFEGFTVEMRFSSLDELDRMLSETSSDGEQAFPFRITEPEEGRFELATHGDIFGESEPTGDEFEMISESMMKELFDMQLRVRLPGEVVTTNADETTEDGVMAWELDPMAEAQVRPEAVSEVSSSSALPIVIVIAVLVVGAATAAVVFLRRGSSQAVETTVPAAPPEGSEGTA